MDGLDIGEVAGRSGVTPAALRHYEAKGLIAPSGRNGLRRRYPPDVLERLALIALCQDAGFTLAEIADLLGDGPVHGLDRGVLTRQADRLDATIGRLTAARDTLRHAAACPAPSHAECPRFRELLRSATAARRTRRPANEGTPRAT